MATSEQQALADILKSQSQGGAAMADGSLGAGANVPAVLDANPATRQLVEESIATRTGQIEEAVASSQAFTGQTSTTTPTTTPTPTEATEVRPVLSSTLSNEEIQWRNSAPYAYGTAEFDAWAKQNPMQSSTTSSALDYEVPEPRSLEEIRQEQLEQAQSVIDATEELYQTEIARLEQQGREQLARTSSIAVGAGLAGSPFQQTAEAKTQEATEDVLASRRAERQAQIAQLMAQAQDQATEQYDKEIARYQQEREFAVSERDKEIVRQQAAKSALASTIANMAAGGISIDDMSEEEYRAMLEESGMSDFEARAIWAQSSPEANAQYSIQNGQLVGYYFDPVSGKPVVTTHALPEGLTASTPATADLKFYTDGTGQGYMFDQNSPTYDAQGNLVMQKIGASDPIEDTGIDAPDIQKIGDNYYQENRITGEWELIDVTNVPDATKIEKATDIYNLVTDILNDPVLDSIVGPLEGRSPRITKESADLQASVNRLKSLLTLDNMGLMKGVLSDTDIKILERAASALEETQKGSEEGFRAELNRILQKVEPFAASQTSSSSLPPLTQSYASLDALVRDNPDYLSFIEQIDSLYPNATDAEILKIIQDEQSVFNSDLSTSLNGSTLKVGDKVLGLGGITGFGSKYWSHGLDIDLKIGDPVPTPATGQVVFAGVNGGFGNQVQVKTAGGNIVMLSHLDSIGVKVGDTIRAGQVVGKGGNTGKVYSTSGGDGSHLDLTVKKPDGSYFTPQEIAQRLTMFG